MKHNTPLGRGGQTGSPSIGEVTAHAADRPSNGRPQDRAKVESGPLTARPRPLREDPEIEGIPASIRDILEDWEISFPTGSEANHFAGQYNLNCSSWQTCKPKGRNIIVAAPEDDRGFKAAVEFARSAKASGATAVQLWELKGYGLGYTTVDQCPYNLITTLLFDKPWIQKRRDDPFAVPGDPEKLSNYPCTERGNGERLVATYGRTLRFCQPWNKWMVFDGQRWKADQMGEVCSRAKSIAREIAAEALRSRDKKKRARLLSWWNVSESRSKLNAMIALAATEAGIPILPEQFDANHWLLNTQSGTIDLKTGKLRSHSAGDYITAMAPVEYDPKAPCPLWERTVLHCFGGNESLARYWQRLAGYSLTGDTSEQILPVLYGSGANGKSTLLTALLEILGTDHAIMAAAGLLVVRRNDQHPTERASLFGKRLVVDVESAEGARLNESLVKQLTGSDRISARRMHEDFWEFSPTHKLMLCTNHQPVIRETKTAIWRRVKLIPFNVTIPEEEQDKELPAKLREEYSGILAWAVRGCIDWQQNGLQTPDEVKQGHGRLSCRAGRPRRIPDRPLHDRPFPDCQGCPNFTVDTLGARDSWARP